MQIAPHPETPSPEVRNSIDAAKHWQKHDRRHGAATPPHPHTPWHLLTTGPRRNGHIFLCIHQIQLGSRGTSSHQWWLTRRSHQTAVWPPPPTLIVPTAWTFWRLANTHTLGPTPEHDPSNTLAQLGDPVRHHHQHTKSEVQTDTQSTGPPPMVEWLRRKTP